MIGGFEAQRVVSEPRRWTCAWWPSSQKLRGGWECRSNESWHYLMSGWLQRGDKWPRGEERAQHRISSATLSVSPADAS